MPTVISANSSSAKNTAYWKLELSDKHRSREGWKTLELQVEATNLQTYEMIYTESSLVAVWFSV